MKLKILTILFFVKFLSLSCNTTEPEFNPDKIFVEVRNGTLESDGEFKVLNYSSRNIFIQYTQFPFCAFFTYTIQQYTDTGLVKLSYNEPEGKWRIPVINPDSVYAVCELAKPPVELKSLNSFEQKITGLDQIGEYRFTIHYTISGESKSFILSSDYKVGY